MLRWALSVLVLCGLYVAVMAAAVLWMPHEWDWQALKWLSASVQPAFSPEVGIVDVTWNPNDVASDRRELADFLDGLVKSGHWPNAVVLDVEFDPCQSNPCGTPMTSARNALVASIKSATRHFPVYAVEQPAVGRDDVVIGPVDPQDTQIYGVVSGAAQTRFTSVPSSQGLFYRLCYPNVPFSNASGELKGTQSVWAMVARVLMSPRVFAASPRCDASHVAVRVGPKLGRNSPAVYAFTGARTFSNYAQFDDRMILIVGTIKYDKLPFIDRSGPELLGWALSNALDEGSLAGDGPYYDVQPPNGLLLVLVPAFSGIAVLAYMAFFFQIKRARLGTWRRRIPWLAAGLAAIAGLTIFAGFEMWLLFAHHIQPQISLVALGIVTAAGLSGVRGHQVLLDEANAIDAAPAETYDYDVFVSYAHEERAWVHDHVFVPFREATLPNGKRLSVFFDTASIRSGTGWQTTLALAIDASRFFVPVYSEAYFRHPYCRFEILRAHRKWILAGEESRCVLPVMRGHTKIMPAVNDIQARSIDDHPDLVQQHIAEIVDRIWSARGSEASKEESVSP